MQCELCGTETPQPRRVLVDKSVLRVCRSCEKFGRLMDGPAVKQAATAGNVPLAMERRKRQQGPSDLFTHQQMQLELVEDFAVRIKAAREKKGWTRQELGAKVGEREVVMGRIENGSLHPPDEVAKKLERELGIKLFEPVSAGSTPAQKVRGLTLGDMLRDAQRKKDP